MKRRITLSIALALCVVLVSLMSSDRAAKAEPPQRFSADTGIVMSGPGQIVRLTVAKGFGNNPDNICIVAIGYGQGTCNGDGVCKHAVTSQTRSDVTLMRGEGASFDIPNTAFGVRGVVLSNSRKARVNALIINSATNEVVAARELALDDLGPFPLN